MKKLQKIVLTGPESSGKTTLTKLLAGKFRAPWVPEYARTYLLALQRAYQETDLLQIARGQLKAEVEAETRASNFLFCDTSMLVIKVWSDVKYGRHHPWIREQLEKNPANLYLLCSPDIPWVFDPLREHPNQRDFLFEVYQNELKSLHLPYVIVGGNLDSRIACATSAIQLIDSNSR